jgi:hypothetical protein
MLETMLTGAVVLMGAYQAGILLLFLCMLLGSLWD